MPRSCPLSRALPLIGAAWLALSAPSAQALNVLLCNDDGFTAANVRALQQRLQAAGHQVLVSAPVDNQSGRGGYMAFLSPIRPIAASYVDPYTGATVVPRALRSHPGLADAAGVGTDPTDTQVAYVNGTPVMACLYGMDVLAPARFGGLPDLVISGPNEGNNLGHINPSSGTVNNTYYAINRRLPAIGISDADTTQREFGSLAPGSRAYEVADIIVGLVGRLEQAAGPNRPLLPKGTGLNVNLPLFAAGTGASLPLKATRMGTATAYGPAFYQDLGLNALARSFGIPPGAGLSGIGLDPSGTTLPSGVVLPTDPSPRSEGNVIAAGGAISVSVIQGVPDVKAADEARVKEALGAR